MYNHIQLAMLFDMNTNAGDFAEHVTFPVTDAFEMSVALGSLTISAINYMYPDLDLAEEEEPIDYYDE